MAAVAVLVVVLIVTGLHSNTPPHHGKAATPTTTAPTQHRHHAATTSTTTTTAAPAVSAPTTASAHTATYQVAAADYSLTLAATTGECWVEATDTATGSVLFTTTLLAGQSHAIAATGPVTVIAGAPGAFSATVNGAPVTLPPGNQAPFTLQFQTAPAALDHLAPGRPRPRRPAPARRGGRRTRAPPPSRPRSGPRARRARRRARS